jgi:Holliday junction resolvasome RuvABC endonuclease subunit
VKIIAFDLGSTMAWATNVPNITAVGSFKFEGTRVIRLTAIAAWLQPLSWNAFEIVVYETPFVRGRDATRVLWGIAGLLEAVVTAQGLPIVDVAVPTIKKFATGSGRAFKVDMIKAAQKFGYSGNNEHEADAVCLLHYAIANLERATK